MESFSVGADDYLRKPFSDRVLITRLRALVRRSTEPRPEDLTVGDLVLNPSRMTCHRSGQEINLTAREFALLEVLMRQHPHVISKTSLLDTVWGFDFDISLNIVEVYIGYLRQKIDRPFNVQSLQTKRGFGYRLVEV